MISSKYKRKKYNLLNLAEIPEKRKKIKKKSVKGETQKLQVVTNLAENTEKDEEISAGDEFETNTDDSKEVSYVNFVLRLFINKASIFLGPYLKLEFNL